MLKRAPAMAGAPICDRIQRIGRPRVSHGKQPASPNVLPVDVIHDNIVNAKASSRHGGCSVPSISREGCRNDNTPTGMDDVHVSEGDVRDLTDRTDITA